MPLLLFGAGCSGKRTTNTEPRTTNSELGTQDTADQTSDSGREESADTEVSDPHGLAYLQLTREAKVTVTRGDESTEGVNNMELYAGDEIEVLAGEARLLYPEFGISILPQGTKITIIPSDKSQNGGFNVDIILEAGKIWTRLEKLLGMDEDFSVESSDVVATVRGTAFGVSIVNGEVDVTVAGHQVSVSSRKALQGAEGLAKAVTLAAGNSIRVNPATIKNLENPRNTLLNKLRKLSDAEKQDIFYRFSTKSLNPEDLKKPTDIFRWSAPINIGDKLKDRLTPLQIKRLEAIRARMLEIRTQRLQDEELMRAKILQDVKFQAPLREVILDNFRTDETPSVTGPVK
ncbi:MAG: hypothetical protein ACOYUZ_06490 [Patescibacteria group bacterium]